MHFHKHLYKCVATLNKCQLSVLGEVKLIRNSLLAYALNVFVVL